MLERTRNVFRQIWEFRKSAIILLTPLLYLPIPIYGQTQAAYDVYRRPIEVAREFLMTLRTTHSRDRRHHNSVEGSQCAYVICIMATYWLTDACHMTVTALLPVIFFPLFGILKANQVSMMYMQEFEFFLIGSIAVSIAIEEWSLHKRFALRILLCFGSEPCRVLLGFMFTTGFLSMWVGNIATVAMMCPVATAVSSHINDIVSKDSDETPTNRSSNLQKAILLGIAYSALLGGTTTIVGSPKNIVAIGVLGATFGDEAAQSVTFTKWMGLALPLGIASVLCTWLWLVVRFLHIRDLFKYKKDPNIALVLREAYNQLPPFGFPQIVTTVHFVLLIMAWLLREPKYFPGWKSLFPNEYAKDSTAAIIACLSLFLFPSKSTSFTWLCGKNTSLVKPSPSLLDWNTFQRKFPWDIALLMGSAFALASACTKSGLSEDLAQFLKERIIGVDRWIVVLMVSSIISLMTEFTSNTTTSTILMPVLLEVAKAAKINPTLLLMVTIISCNYSFALPISSPIVAMVFSFGKLVPWDSISTGIPLKIINVGLLNVFTHLIGDPIFGFDTLPDWANTNFTMRSTNSSMP